MSLRQRYLATLEKITTAAIHAGRDPKSVKLVVVTKSQPLDIVREAVEAGAAILGENYPEEAVTKIQSMAEYSAVEWHMIGHVQSRKAQIVAQNFHLLHSLDSLKLAKRLDRFCGEANRKLDFLFEFNVGGEDSKSGWDAADESKWSILTDELEQVISLPNLRARGLMCMPPLGQEAEMSRRFFQKLRGLQEFLSSRFPHVSFSELSMGTSADFEVAIQEGATYVRVGTAIVGARNYKTEN